jgi:SSS family solute:Na+ symporter
MMFGFVVTLSYACSDQVVVQRYAATRKAVTMMFSNYVVSISYIALLVMVGASLLLYYLRVPGAMPAGESIADPRFTDRAFQYFIVHFLPTGATGLVMAALFGAAQSTLDSGINSLSAVISNDIVPALGRSFDERDSLRAARWATRGVGVGVMVMAIAVDNLPGSNNIVDVAQKVVHLAFGPMGALFIVAMFVRYVGALAVNIALVIGVLCAGIFAFHDVITGRGIISPILIIPGSWLITLVAAMLLGIFNRATDDRSTTAPGP